jgi:hypothetical protein
MEEAADAKARFEQQFYAFWRAPKRKRLLARFEEQADRPIYSWTRGGCALAAEAIRRWFAFYGFPVWLVEADVQGDKREHVLADIGGIYFDPQRIGDVSLFATLQMLLYDAGEDILSLYPFDERICRLLVVQLQEELGPPPYGLYKSQPAQQEPLPLEILASSPPLKRGSKSKHWIRRN